MFLYHYIDEEWLPFRRKACWKKEMGFYIADIKAVNQQVNKQQYKKYWIKYPKHGIYICDITCKDAQLNVVKL